MQENPNAFWLRALGVLGLIIVLWFIGRAIMVPGSWGEIGYYRADAIKDELAKPLVHGQNESCKSCHAEVYDLKQKSEHTRLACESCHAPVSTHIQDGKKIGDMPHKAGDAQIALCLSCHQKVVGRPEKFPMIDHIKHLEEQGVKTTHTCDQCHIVHAPLDNIKKAKKDMKSNLAEEIKNVK